MAKRKNQNLESKKKILIIDDEPDIVVYLTTLLEDQKFVVVSASDGEQGLELIRKERPDLVCLDIMMPRKTGVALYQEVKTDPELKSIPCIIISAYESAYTFKGQAFRRLVQNRSIPEPLRFFEKPLDIPVFLEFINSLFRKAGKK
jgi:two-component system phosphate regulon response regulator PhoB